MSWTESGVAWFWARIAHSCPVEPRSLALLRLLLGPFMLVIGMPYTSWVGRAAPGFFDPPILSPANLLSGLPPPWLCALLDSSVVVLIVLATLGVRARITLASLCVVGLLSSNLGYSFGKIDHDAMVWVVIGCLAFSGAGRSLALWPDPPSRWDAPQRSLSLLAVCLAFGMFSAGFGKALNWVDFDTKTSGFLAWFYPGYFDYGRTRLLAPLVLGVPPRLFELADYCAVLFELGGLPALLLGPRVFRGWLLVACSFHLSNTLVLNIAFDCNLPAYLAFVNLTRIERALRARLGAFQRFARSAVVAGVVTGAAVHLLQRSQGGGSRHFFVQDATLSAQLNLFGSVALWLAALVVMTAELRSRRVLPA